MHKQGPAPGSPASPEAKRDSYPLLSAIALKNRPRKTALVRGGRPPAKVQADVHCKPLPFRTFNRAGLLKVRKQTVCFTNANYAPLIIRVTITHFTYVKLSPQFQYVSYALRGIRNQNGPAFSNRPRSKNLSVPEKPRAG